jgi:hypothetical protein
MRSPQARSLLHPRRTSNASGWWVVQGAPVGLAKGLVAGLDGSAQNSIWEQINQLWCMSDPEAMLWSHSSLAPSEMIGTRGPTKANE